MGHRAKSIGSEDSRQRFASITFGVIGHGVKREERSGETSETGIEKKAHFGLRIADL